jgi:hypothetical protein
MTIPTPTIEPKTAPIMISIIIFNDKKNWKIPPSVMSEEEEEADTTLT